MEPGNEVIAIAVFPQAVGAKVGDWVLAVNGIGVLYKTHSDVVKLIRESGDELALEITTSVSRTGSEHRNSV